MRRTNLRTIAVALAAAAFAYGPASSAWAQDDKVAKAAVLARDAETLMQAGKVGEACDKLEESQALDPRGSTVLDLALCREKEGRIGTAYLLFDQAEKIATDEKRTDRANTASARKKALFLKLPRVTVVVPKEVVVDGLEVRVGLAANARALNVVPPSEWGKGFPVDPGDLKVMVTAPAKATWEQTFDLKQAGRKTVTVPELKAGDGPPPLPPPVTTPPLTTGGDGKGGTEPVAPGQPTPDKPKPSGPFKHEAGRVVVDAGILAGGHLSLIHQAPLSDINGTQYIYRGEDESEFLASCGNTRAVPGAGDCDATYNPQFGFAGGAQLFLGYAITEEVQFGGRFFGGAHYPLGFFVLGGPSISFAAAGPLWIGVSALVGTTQIEATVTGGRGSIPEGNRADNGGSSQIKIPVEDLAGRGHGVLETDPPEVQELGEIPFNSGQAAAGAFAGFEVGASVEISILLADNPTDDAGSGALFLSAWPTGMWAPGHGGIIALPVGLGYRFY